MQLLVGYSIYKSLQLSLDYLYNTKLFTLPRPY